VSFHMITWKLLQKNLFPVEWRKSLSSSHVNVIDGRDDHNSEGS